jgi:hypothetical protein
MKLAEILTVEGTYLIAPQMLVLRPHFSTPQGGWKKRTEKVTVVRPDGSELEATAVITMTHLNISGPSVAVEERYPTTMWLTDRIPEEVPLGSKIMASHEVREALFD